MYDQWTPDERAVLDSFSTPADVQAWLDLVPYSTDPIYRSPRSVMRDRRAHCFDGALFAAAALERLGFPPLIVELGAWRDDDHILAIFHRGRHMGAVAKSNFAGLRFRDPIFRTLRELALSYFDGYFNLDRERSLRSVSVKLDLHTVDRHHWRTDDRAMDLIAERLDAIRHTPLMTPEMAPLLRPIDDRTWNANMVGIDLAGVVSPAEAEAAKRRQA